MARSDKQEDQVEDTGVSFEDGDGYTFNMKETKEDSGFTPLPEGTYLVTIEEVKYGMSKTGNPKWDLKYAIAEGEFAEKNRKVFDLISLKVEQQGRVKKFINRVAPELAEVEQFSPKKVAEEGLLIGKQLKVKLGIEDQPEEYGGGKRNRVKDHYAPGSGGASTGGFSM